MAAASTARYVYGVVRARRRAAKTEGIGGADVRVVAAGKLGALTSAVPDEPLEAGREELLAHARVLERTLEAGVVLPMRFGVVLPNDAAIRDDLLTAHSDQLESQLDELDGKVELNVKAIYDEGEILREILANDRDVAELNALIQRAPADAVYYERIRLGELVAGAVAERREQDEGRILSHLEPHAAALDVGPPIHERMVVNAAFLVESKRLEAFDATLEELAEADHPRIGFKLTGPLPPHSFVELSVDG